MVRLNIKGERWKIFIFEGDEYRSKFGDTTSGFTDVKRKQMFYCGEDLDLELVKHELWHAYATHLRLDAVKLEPGQLEEIFAEMFAKDGSRIIQQATELFEKLRGLE